MTDYLKFVCELILKKSSLLPHVNAGTLTKEEINKAYLKIQKRIHPDVSPETSRLSSIVNEARDVLLNEIK